MEHSYSFMGCVYSSQWGMVFLLILIFIINSNAQTDICTFERLDKPRNVRVLLHFVSGSNKDGNFIRKKRDNIPRGRKWARTIINESNRQLSDLKPNWKSPDGTKKITDAAFRLRLKGVKFIYNDALACIDNYEERASHTLNEAYGSKLHKAINIYFFEDYFRGMENGGGIANRSHRPEELFIKMYNYGYTKTNKFQGAEWILREEVATLIHEIGHILGLDHDWYQNDNITDTSPYKSRSCRGDENEWKNCSNNYMTIPPTYSSLEGSFTPCQIAKMHEEMRGSINIYVK